MDAHLYLSVEKLDVGGLVMLLVEELEVDVAEVDDDEVDGIFSIFFELSEYLLLIFLLGVHLCLTHF